MNLGGRLRKAREARGIEGKALAERVGMSQPRLSALETRDSKTCEEAAALADALGISLRWLVSGEGAPEDTDWPFPMVDRARWDDLKPEQRAYVEGAINAALDACTAGKPLPHLRPVGLQKETKPGERGAPSLGSPLRLTADEASFVGRVSEGEKNDSHQNRRVEVKGNRSGAARTPRKG